MNVFIAIAALLTLLVTAWLIRPLLRKTSHSGISSERLNAAIHRDQLKTLEADLARGIISQQDFETSRDELQLRLLDDTESFTPKVQPNASGFWTARRTATLVGLSMPLLALGLYWQLGAPTAIEAQPAGHGNAQQIQQMIDGMADKLKANPDNPRGWAMLGRAYKAVNRLPEAVQAFEKAGTAVNTDADLLVEYAELLAMQAGNSLKGQPAQMVSEALRLNPEHPMGLMLSGIASFQDEKFKDAVTKWEKLLAMMNPDSPDAEQMRSNIAEARGKAGMSPPTESNKLPPVPAGAAAGMTPEKINEMVNKLAERLKANPDDLPGWARLARAYKVQGRLDEAEQAYAKTGKLLDTDADLVAQYVDVLATRAKGDFKGKPTQLIASGLKINPKHPLLLMMAGQAAFQRADYTGAVGHWEAVLTVLPADSQDAQQVKAEIASAKARIK